MKRNHLFKGLGQEDRGERHKPINEFICLLYDLGVYCLISFVNTIYKLEKIDLMQGTSNHAFKQPYEAVAYTITYFSKSLTGTGRCGKDYYAFSSDV
jgi:hypothetical protein